MNIQRIFQVHPLSTYKVVIAGGFLLICGLLIVVSRFGMEGGYGMFLAVLGVPAIATGLLFTFLGFTRIRTSGWLRKILTILWCSALAVVGGYTLLVVLTLFSKF